MIDECKMSLMMESAVLRMRWWNTSDFQIASSFPFTLLSLLKVFGEYPRIKFPAMWITLDSSFFNVFVSVSAVFVKKIMDQLRTP